MWTPQQRLEIDEHAAKNGNASTIRFLSSKYPRLTKQSITEFKKAYNKGKQKGADLSDGIVMKSRGRPTLLPETLMKKTIDTISALRLRGAPVISSLINAVAKGIVQANNRTLLVENVDIYLYQMIGQERFYIVWTPLNVRWPDKLQPPPEFL